MNRRRRLDDRTAEALLAGRDVAGEPELADFVQQLRAEALQVPVPSAALAAMLEHGLDLEPVTAVAPVAPRRTWALPLQLSLGGAACIALVLGAAANNDLPAPAQTAVANAVEAITPLHVPRPAVASHAPRPRPTPARVTPRPSHSPEPAEGRRSPRPTPSAGTHRGEQTHGPGRTEDHGSPRPSGSPQTSEHPNPIGGGEHHGPGPGSDTGTGGRNGSGTDGSGHDDGGSGR